MNNGDDGGGDNDGLRGGGRKGGADNPTDAAALSAIGERLTELLEGVKAALQNQNAQSKTSDGSSEPGGDAASGPIKTEMGWRVRLGGLEFDGAARGDARPGGALRPRRRSAGQRSRSRAAPSARAAHAETPKPAPRAAHVEVFDEADALVVTAELPGVAASDVSLDLQGAELHIRADGARPFQATAALPDGFDPAAEPSMRLSNGVLEVRIPKSAAG